MSETIVSAPNVKALTVIEVQDGLVSGTVKQSSGVRLQVGSTGAVFPIGNVNAVAVLNIAISGPGQAIYSLAAGNAGVPDVYGNNITFNHIIDVQVQNTCGSASSGPLVIVNDGFSVFGGDVYTVYPGGTTKISNPNPGFQVTSGSRQDIYIQASHGGWTFGVITILGRKN